MIFGDDMKDFSVAICSLLLSDLIARSTFSFCKRRAKTFGVHPPMPSDPSRLSRCDWRQRWSMARDLICMQLKKLTQQKSRSAVAEKAFIGAC
jgi:hypothetical protein